MSISLLGVVGLQLYWISDAIRVKQEQFDRSVHEALAKVVEKLETREAVSAVANGMATLQHAPEEHTSQPEVVAEITPPIPASEKAEAPEAIPATATAKVSRKQETASRPASASLESRPLPPDPPVPPLGRVRSLAGSNYIYIGSSSADSAFLSRSFRDAASATASLAVAQLEQLALAHGRAGLDTLPKTRSKGSSSFRVERITSGAVTYSRQLEALPLRISVDTLQYIALHLDSIWRQQKHNILINPEEIASINVVRDSVFIVKNARAATLHSQRPTAPTLSGSVQFRRADRPQEADRPAAGRLLVREKQPQTISDVPATGQASKDRSSKTQVTPPEPEAPAVPDLAKMEAKKEKLNDVVEKMVVEYVSKDVPLQERLNLTNLKPMLQAELNNRGICLDFGYWVLSSQQDTVAAEHIATPNADSFATYKANLFPNDIFDKTDYLAVYFPDSMSYALQSLWVMLLFSAVFTLVIVATFGTTIHIIFKQKKLSDMKNDFINNMTHEFKTPIATISLATESVANPKVYQHPEKIKYYTNIIRQENKRMNAQVENVLQIAQLEKNEFAMNLQPVDLHLLIVKAVESIRLQVEERFGQITAQLNALEHELKLDEVHAYNVICNLLDNANKYSPSSPEIRLVTQNVEGGILLAVEDKGMGMTRDTQLRVFDKFYRVPTGNLHNVKGFGLGLSYVKAIVKAHHGNIRLQSEPGKGSRFEIFLPFNA